jgi:hypothetical protein
VIETRSVRPHRGTAMPGPTSMAASCGRGVALSLSWERRQDQINSLVLRVPSSAQISIGFSLKGETLSILSNLSVDGFFSSKLASSPTRVFRRRLCAKDHNWGAIKFVARVRRLRRRIASLVASTDC